MRRFVILGSWLLAVWTTAAAGDLRAASPPHPAPGVRAPQSAPPGATFDTYCVTCHNQRVRTAGLALDTFGAAGTVSANAEVWEKVIQKLRTRTMPPAGRPRPDEATYDAVASWLETEIDRSAAANPDPGRTEAFHRLNRIEYQNAVRDLLAIEVDVAALLPPDNTYESGFDNNAASLSVTPSQIERYLSAAGKIGRLAMGIPPAVPLADTYKVPLNLWQDGRMSDDLPFGSRGGVAIRHYFPVDGEYGIKIALQKSYNDYIRGMATRQQLDIRVDGVRVKRFSVGGAQGKPTPASFAGNIFGSPEWERFLLTSDEGLEVRFPAKAGPRVVSVSFERSAVQREGVVQPPQSGFPLAADERYNGHAAVDTVSIQGPFSVAGPGDTPSRRRILICAPSSGADEESCAGTILRNLARRAYRRPVTSDDVDVLLAFYKGGRSRGKSFDEGIELALERLLIDPDFLVRIERVPAGVPPGTAYRVSDLDLASRLSFFLWNSIPDDVLLENAEQGKLREPASLERQVRRMLADARARSFVGNFAGQWLNLRNLESALPDPDRFPAFDENLRDAFRQETELFVESTIREDRSILDLVGANYTFVNERLAAHYGIPNIYGHRFQRVTFDASAPRGGLLGHGSILTVSSYPTRTSPVLRGKWLLQNLLGIIPPEPPPNVPLLPEPGEAGHSASVRELLEQHRNNPGCVSCHAAMDPLGFALENFDAIGAWRATYEGGAALDASGTMPGGAAFNGPAGLRAHLLARRELFVGTVAEKLLAYALGRAIEYHDRPALRTIVRGAAPDYRWSSLMLGIVNSSPFQMRRSAERVASAANR